MKKQTILVCVSHSDDQVIGMGSSIAKFASEGKDVIVVIFSYGAESVPWMKEKHIIETRVKESMKIDKFLGAKKTIFLGLSDKNMEEKIKKFKTEKKLELIIKKYSPEKIFTHALDPHPNHRIVHKTVLKVLDSMKKNIPVYTFDIWKMFDTKEQKARIYIDITETFSKKIKAMMMFKSQMYFSIYPLLPSVYLKAFLNGVHIKTRYAEMFYKER